jgi:hypothetical protein
MIVLKKPSNTISYTFKIEKLFKKEENKMIKEEDYMEFLKMIISCISQGDYFAVKELSNLELEKLKKSQNLN